MRCEMTPPEMKALLDDPSKKEESDELMGFVLADWLEDVLRR